VSVRAEIVGVGTELLLGQIANTNARWISERLATVGVDVLHHQAVGDNIPRIVEVLRVALGRADVVLVTGGLGPTEDDLTRDAIAELLGAPMVRHPEIEDLLRLKFAGFGRGDMPLSNLRQADVPEGVRTITPDRGTAPGLVADRTPEITREVDRLPNPAYAFFRGSDAAAWFAEGLARRGISFARRTIGDFELFTHLSVPVRSHDLPVSPTW